MIAEANRQIFARIVADLDHAVPQGVRHPEENDIQIDRLAGPGATSNGYRLRYAADPGEGRDLFVKQFRPAQAGTRQLETDYATACWLAAELGNQDDFRVLAPLLVLPGEGVMVTPFVVGENLGPYFFRRLRWGYVSPATEEELLDIAERLGTGLARLQRIPAKRVRQFFGRQGKGLSLYELHAQLASYVEFHVASGICPSLVELVAVRVKECFAEYLVREPAGCFQHNDYILQNFILGQDGRLHLFDFANSTCGCPCFDIAHMLNAFEDLTYLKSVSRVLVARLKQAFLGPLKAESCFEPRMLAAMRAYIQLYSSTILLSGAGGRRRSVLRDAVMVDPRRRLESKLRARLAELER